MDRAHREGERLTARRVRRATVALAGVVALLSVAPTPVGASEFDETLARVDEGLRTNPGHVPRRFLESCQHRRNAAVRLQQMGLRARAARSLAYCLEILELTEVPEQAEAEPPAPTMEEIQARAAQELERALALTPDAERGLEVYRGCAGCHLPEGWGLANGTVPQIAGQHRTVIIKQLADIRAGNRESALMLPYASVEAIGGAQAVADVAAYIGSLEISVANGKGPGLELELGERLYRENCARCHGATGEGDRQASVPRIQAQHYRYLLRQFEWIRDGRRRNANAEMVSQIRGFDDREMSAVLDYVSRLEPPSDLQAPPEWRNPDFPRSPMR